MRTTLLFSLLLLSAKVAYAQSARTVFVEGAASPGLVLSGESSAMLSLVGSLGFRVKSVSLEGSLGDLLFRESKATTANFTFVEAAGRVFIPSTGRAEIFARASVGAGAFADAVTSQATTALTSSFGMGLQYQLSPNRYIGFLAKVQSVQLSTQTAAQLAAGDLGLRVGFVF